MSRIICCCITLVLLLAGPASAQWETRYQEDPVVAFNAVTFPTSTIGYAVGDVIYKSTDGGFSWVEQDTDTLVISTLTAVFFKSATEGWAVGHDGMIIYTTDGETWSEHAQSGVITTARLYAIAFDGDTGFLGGANQEIWRTTDGGANWTLAIGGFTRDVTGISFFSSQVGVATIDGPVIVRSTDGGASWDTASVNLGPYPYGRTDIEAVKTVNDTVAVATGWGSMVGAQPTIILVSRDTGQTWNIADTDYHWETYGYGNCITVFDDGEIVISGGGSGSAAFVLHSTDLGSTWTTTPVFTGDYVYGVAAVPGTDRCVAVSRYSLIAVSTDKAVSWEVLTSPRFGFNGFMKMASRGSTIYAVGDLSSFFTIKPDGAGYDVAFQTIAPNNFGAILYDIEIVPTADGSGSVIYVSGGYHALYKSTDGGATWTRLSHTFGVTDRFRGMHWFDVDNGILVGTRGGRDAIYVTDDGGETLTEVWYNVTYRDFDDISFAPENPLVGVIAGNYGPRNEDDEPYYVSLHYTTDGGGTWNRAATDISPTNIRMYSVQMLSETTGWAVGSSGIVAKTTDGGQTWTQQPAFTTEQLNAVYFDHPKLGWIAGRGNTCVRTDDGGASWTDIAPAQLPTSTEYGEVVYFQGSQGVLWYGGRDFFLFSSNDAALTDADTPLALPFALGQNFPNPFNPSTTIKFSLHRDGLVSLNVYDVAGRRVATVLEKEMKAGDHSLSFNAGGLASGVYFYRLQTADLEQTRKMILLR